MSDVSSEIIVREARREDMKQVAKLIQDLADYEEMGKQVKINSETLMRDGFDTVPPCFGCFVAEAKNGSIIGFALYFHCYSTWVGKSIFLEDLYVKDEYRTYGVGKQLLLQTARVAHITNKRLDFHVLSTNPAITFYKKLGAINASATEKWQLFRFEEKQLTAMMQQYNLKH